MVNAPGVRWPHFVKPGRPAQSASELQETAGFLKSYTSEFRQYPQKKLVPGAVSLPWSFVLSTASRATLATWVADGGGQSWLVG